MITVMLFLTQFVKIVNIIFKKRTRWINCLKFNQYMMLISMINFKYVVLRNIRSIVPVVRYAAGCRQSRVNLVPASSTLTRALDALSKPSLPTFHRNSKGPFTHTLGCAVRCYAALRCARTSCNFLPSAALGCAALH